MGRKLYTNQDDPNEMLFHCPGCKYGHGIRSAPPKNPDYPNQAVWTFNGDLEKPTFSPSYLTGTKNFTERRCHSYIKDGMIEFLSDCWHPLAGQTVELPDINGWGETKEEAGEEFENDEFQDKDED